MDIKIFHPIETMRHSAKNKKKTRRRVFVPFYMVPLRKRRCWQTSSKGSRIESSSEVTRLRITRHGMAKLKSWCKRNTLSLPFFPFSPPSFVVLIRPIEVKFSFPLEIQRLFKMIFFPWKTFHGQFAHNFRTDSSFPSHLRAERNGAPLSSFFVFRRTTWSGRDDFHGINFGRGSF